MYNKMYYGKNVGLFKKCLQICKTLYSLKGRLGVKIKRYGVQKRRALGGKANDH